MLMLYNNMTAIELISFALSVNFFQFLITNMMAELFWASQLFNRSNQNLVVNRTVFVFVEALFKTTPASAQKACYFNFFLKKK